MTSSTPMNTPFVPTIRVLVVKIKRHSVLSTLWYSTAFLPLTKPPPLSREGWSNVKQQKGLDANTFKRRASLPPEEREHTASYHHVGTRSGMHPEDNPFITTRTRYPAPTTATYFEVDEEGEEVYTRPPTRTSARRYDLTPYRHGGRERQTEELPRQGKHPLFYIGICLMILVLFITAYTYIPPTWQRHLDDMQYGYPRTFQTDANVGRGIGTSHFLVVNVHGTIEVVEIPNTPNNTTVQPHLYIIMHLSGQGADLVPATLSFPDVNGDGKPDLQVTVYNGANPSIWILFNNGTIFVPKL